MKNIKILLQCTLLLLILSLLTGIIYPLFITLVGQICLPSQANGSILSSNGKIIGSTLIGQKFSGNRYFHSRPSSTNYNALPSGGSNLTQVSLALRDSASVRKGRFIRTNNSDSGNVPADMIFASASGLDPHISPDAAMQQIERICVARNFDNLSCARINKLVLDKLEKPQWYIFGEYRVNVLLLNMALDSLEAYNER